MDFDNGATKPTIYYAQKLRRMGYRTAIHALPQEGQDLVNSLLDRGYNNTFIAKEINGEYEQYLKDKELKLISNYSIRTYKNNYWINSPEFSKIISTGNPTIKKKLTQVKDRADQLLLKFNALEQLIEVALKVKALIIDKDSPYELSNPMGFIDSGRSKERWRYFLMCEKIFKIQFELGMIKPLPQSSVNRVSTIKNEDETKDKRSLKEQLTEIYNSIENKNGYEDIAEGIAKLEN